MEFRHGVVIGRDDEPPGGPAALAVRAAPGIATLPSQVLGGPGDLAEPGRRDGDVEAGQVVEQARDEVEVVFLAEGGYLVLGLAAQRVVELARLRRLFLLQPLPPDVRLGLAVLRLRLAAGHEEDHRLGCRLLVREHVSPDRQCG